MVLGVVAYGYIVASVAASLANADSARAQYQEKLKAVKSYMAVREMCHASVCSYVCVRVYVHIKYVCTMLLKRKFCMELVLLV